MADFEVDVYLTYDNVFTLTVKINEVAVDLISTGVTRVVLATDTGALIDSDKESNIFDWTTDGATGKIHCALGALEGLTAGRFYCQLIIYDPVHINGQVWDTKFFMNVWEVPDLLEMEEE